MYPEAPGIQAIQKRGFSNQVGLILEPVSRCLGFTVLPRFARRAFHKQDTLQVVESGIPVVDTLWLIYDQSGLCRPEPGESLIRCNNT